MEEFKLDVDNIASGEESSPGIVTILSLLVVQWKSEKGLALVEKLINEITNNQDVSSRFLKKDDFEYFLNWVSRVEIPTYDEKVTQIEYVPFLKSVKEAFKIIEDSKEEMIEKFYSGEFKYFGQASLFEGGMPDEMLEVARVIEKHLEYLFDESVLAPDSSPEKIKIPYRAAKLIKDKIVPLLVDAKTIVNGESARFKAIQAYQDFILYPSGCPLSVFTSVMPFFPKDYLEWSVLKVFDQIAFNCDCFSLPEVELFIYSILSIQIDDLEYSLDELINIPKTNFSRHILESHHYGNGSFYSLSPKASIELLNCVLDEAPKIIGIYFKNSDFSSNSGVGLFVDGLHSMIQAKISDLKKLRIKNKKRPIAPVSRLSELGEALYISETRIGWAFQQDISTLVASYPHPLDEGYCGYCAGSFSSPFVSDIEGRSEHFSKIYEAAMSEGWIEFALASLAWFFYTQPLFSEYINNSHGLECNWGGINSCLADASKYQGFVLIQKAMRFCQERIINLSGKLIDDSCFRQWLEINGQNNIQLPDGGRLSARERVIDLISGSRADAIAVWLSLPIEAKHSLSQAELLWSKHSHEIGSDGVSMSGILIEYAKSIESIIKSIYGFLSNDDAFAQFYYKTKGQNLPKHIDVGFYNYNLMKNFCKLPPELQEKIINKKIRIQDNAVLIENTMKFLGFRNEAAHPSGLSDFQEKTVRIREFLFKKGGLRELAANLRRS